MAGLWEKAKYWLDILSSHGVGVKAVSEVCPRAGGLSRRRRDRIIVIVIAIVIAIAIAIAIAIVIVIVMVIVVVIVKMKIFDFGTEKH